MNSALQCLSATKPLTDYFLSEMYKRDINRNNPLGMGGEIAERYGELLRSIWNGRYHSISPSRFKSALGRFAPQFSGYQQQDSQEFLAFLLDGLHEDLNRVKIKPYISAIEDSNERSEQTLATEAWRIYKARNQSVVVDLFQGQFRSTVRCPCGYVSITFDPFMYLSCPVTAGAEDRVVVLTLARRDPFRPHRRFALKVSQRGLISELKQRLAEQARDIFPEDMCVVEIYKHRIRRSLTDKKAIASINDGDVIYVYEIPSFEAKREGTFLLRLLHVDSSTQQPFGHPIIVPIPEKISNRHLVTLCNKAILQRILLPTGGSIANGFASDKAPTFEGVDGMLSSYYTLQTMEGGHLVPLPSDESEANLEDRDAVLVSWAPEVIEAATRASDLEFGDSAGGNATNGFHTSDDDSGNNRSLSVVERLMAKTLFRFEPPVEMDDSVGELMQWERKRAQERQRLSLRQCLQLFTSPEKLSSENAWYCLKCRACTEATKQLSVWFFPHILVIHLKRFEYNRYFREKLDVDVDFPLESLDLSEFELHRPPPAPWPSASPPASVRPQEGEDVIDFNNSPPLYDLFAVSCHSGGLGCGHYTAFAKHGAQWHSFNDSVVSPVSETDVKGPEAYVLFYRRRTRGRNGMTTSRSQPNFLSRSPSFGDSLR